MTDGLRIPGSRSPWRIAALLWLAVMAWILLPHLSGRKLTAVAAFLSFRIFLFAFLMTAFFRFSRPARDGDLLLPLGLAVLSGLELTVTYIFKAHDGLLGGHELLQGAGAWLGLFCVAHGSKGYFTSPMKTRRASVILAGLLLFMASLDPGRWIPSTADAPRVSAAGRASPFLACSDWSHWRRLAAKPDEIDTALLDETLRTTADPRHRATLLWLAGTLDPLRLETDLLAALSDSEPAPRMAAAQVLGMHGFERHRESLERLAEDPVRLVALTALEALIVHGHGDRRILWESRRRERLNAGNAFRIVGSDDRFPLRSVEIRMAEQDRRAMYRNLPEAGEPAFLDYRCLYALDGGPLFEGKVRLRGLGPVHYRNPSKSLKLVLDRRDPRAGSSLNLNTIFGDWGLEDEFAARFYGLAEIPFYRCAFVRLAENGDDMGWRQNVENHDEYFLAVRHRPVGNLYREEIFVDWNVFNWDDTSYLAANWKNKVRNADVSLDDLANLHRIVNTIPDDVYLEHIATAVDLDQVARWYAVTVLMGTFNQNVHNIILYHDPSEGRFQQFPFDVYRFYWVKSVSLVLSPFFEKLLTRPDWNLSRMRHLHRIFLEARAENFLADDYETSVRHYRENVLARTAFRPEYLDASSRAMPESWVSVYRDSWAEHGRFLDSVFEARRHWRLTRSDSGWNLVCDAEHDLSLVEIRSGDRRWAIGRTYRPRWTRGRIIGGYYYPVTALEIVPAVVPLPDDVDPGRPLHIKLHNPISNAPESFHLDFPASP